MVTLTHLLLGADAIEQRTPAGMARPAMFIEAISRIVVQPGATGAALNWFLAHELAERHLARAGCDSEYVEQLADAIGAALIMPAPAFRLALAHVGRNLPALAEMFRATQSVVAIRLGSVTGTPVALVTPRRIHVSGDAWAWPCEADLRRFARGRLPADLERRVITDARRRVVLTAAA